MYIFLRLRKSGNVLNLFSISIQIKNSVFDQKKLTKHKKKKSNNFTWL